MEFQGTEPMTLGSPTSPKSGLGAQFLPGFLMGDLPAPVTPQPRSFGGGVLEIRSPDLAGGSPPLPVVPTPKDKSGAPPVRSIYDELSSPRIGISPLSSRKQPFTVLQTSLSGLVAATPGTSSSVFSPAGFTLQGTSVLSPAQADPFYAQGEDLSSEAHLDDTWVTVFGFPPASASYILLQFAQYGNILKHMMSNTGNWMHIKYQSRLQARKALSKDGKVFGDVIMIGVKFCIEKNTLECSDGGGGGGSPSGPVFTPLKTAGTPCQPVSTPRSAMRALSAVYKASSSDYQVVSDTLTPRKNDSFVSKAMEYMFGW